MVSWICSWLEFSPKYCLLPILKLCYTRKSISGMVMWSVMIDFGSCFNTALSLFPQHLLQPGDISEHSSLDLPLFPISATTLDSTCTSPGLLIKFSLRNCCLYSLNLILICCWPCSGLNRCWPRMRNTTVYQAVNCPDASQQCFQIRISR